MSAPAAPVDRSQPRWVTPALLTLVALPAAFTIGTLLWASGYGQGRGVDGEVLSAAVFATWALLPFVAMGTVVVLAARRVPGAVAAVAVGVLVLGGLTVVLLLDFIASESSTAALLFVFLPLYQLLVVAATAAATLIVHLVLRRRRARRASPHGPQD